MKLVFPKLNNSRGESQYSSIAQYIDDDDGFDTFSQRVNELAKNFADVYVL
jgi:hypothetical protein